MHLYLDIKFKSFVVFISMILFSACSPSGTVKEISPSSQEKIEAITCPEQPTQFLDAADSDKISFENSSIQISGTAKPRQYISYQFSGESNQQLSYSTDDNICIWIYTEDHKILHGKSLPKNGDYIIQISTNQGSRTFEVDLSLDEKEKITFHQESDLSNTSNNLPDLDDTSASPIKKTPQKISSQQTLETFPKTTVTQRVSFNSGDTGTTVSSELKPNQAIRYLLRCSRNQLMVVEVPQSNVDVLILSPKGEQIGVVPTGLSRWEGLLPSDGDYIVEVSGDEANAFEIRIDVL